MNTGERQTSVLIVEDHEDTRRVLERFLSRSGFNVSAAANLHDGIEFVRQQSFDAIISDIALPDGTGYALISEARKRGVSALAIALSAYSYPQEVTEAKLTGFDFHLGKPFDCVQLRELIKQGLTTTAPGAV